MVQPPPAEPGAPVDEIDTPALIIDLDAFEHNLDHMAALAREAAVKLRPHAKTHKSPVIARLQIERGAVGQCVQKIAEAEVLAWGGVGDILVSNEVAGPRKLARFAALSRISTAAICVDSEAGVAALEAAAEDAGARLTALIEIDVGMDRCGVPPAPPSPRWRGGSPAAAGSGSAGFRPIRGAPSISGPPRSAGRAWRALSAVTGETVADAQGRRARLPDRRGRGDRHLRPRSGERSLYGTAGRLLRLHGRGLCPQRAGAALSPSRCSCWRP